MNNDELIVMFISAALLSGVFLFGVWVGSGQQILCGAVI